ncbi:MAG: hypothetical protein K9N51_04255 [Candidatus Pacebacteria bacterium]|nr:hypothetical protein [Candidatus Paceibacterota bacterium]
MHDWVDTALALQENDRRIAKLEAQIASVPAEKKEATASLSREEEALKNAKAEVSEKEKAIKHVEIDIDTLNDKRQDFATKSTMIKDNEEYRKAMHQIEHCRKQVEELEDQELELMETLEKARSALQEEKTLYAAAQERVKQLMLDLDKRHENCTTQLAQIEQNRSELKTELPSDVASKYERILKNRRANGADITILAPIRGYNCGACHMNIPPQVRMDASKGLLVSCPQCGTLLYTEG